MLALRTDGQRISGNPALQQVFETDKLICEAERQKANLSGVTISNGGYGVFAQKERQAAAETVFRGCLAQKGYVMVREDQAIAKNAEFIAVANAGTQQQQQQGAAPTPKAVVTGSARQ